jgi:sec-independent protein translocase protein TatB
MIEISLGKLVLLALIALIVLGPEKLPGAARTAGALLRRVRSGWDNVRAEVERELEIEEIKRAAHAAAARAEAAQAEITQGLQQVRTPLAEVVTLVKPADSAVTEAAAAALPEPAENVQAELPLGAPPQVGEETPHDHA